MYLFNAIVKKMNLTPTHELIVRNLFWSVLGKVVTLIGGLFVGILIARYLGPEQYGLMNYVISYVFLFQVFSAFGLDSIEVREEAKHDVPYEKTIGTAFGIRLFFAVITVILCIATTLLFEADTETIIFIALYSTSIICNTFAVIRNYFLAIVQNEYVVKAEISRTLIGIVIKVVLLWTHQSLFWFILASAFDCVLLCGGYLTAYRTVVGKISDWRFDFQYSRLLLHEGFPLLLTNAAVIIYQRIDQVMIGDMVDKVAVGYFSTAAKFVEIIIFIPMMIGSTISPILVNIRKNDETLYREKAQLFMNVTVWMCTLIATIVSGLAYWIILYTYGAKYLAAVSVLQILVFKAPSVALSSTAGCMLVIEGLQKKAVIRDSLGCVVCILLNYLLLPHYGICAAAFIAILSNLVAGYVADAFIPEFRHLFVSQSKAILLGWKDLLRIKELLTNPVRP